MSTQGPSLRPDPRRLPIPQYQSLHLTRRFLYGLRHPVWWIDDLTGSGPVYALLILFGLNAVDELDRMAFAILLPDIRDHFNLTNQGILTVLGMVAGVALLLQIPVAQLADRYNRTRLLVIGAVAWSFFSFGTGLSMGLWILVVMRWGSGLGKAVVDPTHNTLLADWFEPALRPRIYAFHRSANSLGQIIGPIGAGLLAYYFDWRVPFLVFAFPTLILVVLALKLEEPVRGYWERKASGVSEEIVNTEEPPPSFAEAYRMVWKIGALRRIFYAMPFLAAALIGFGSLAGLLYADEFGLEEIERGWLAAAVEPFSLVGLYVGARVGMRLFAKDPGAVLRFLSVATVVASALAAGFAMSPPWFVTIFGVRVPWVAALCNIGITASLAIVVPGIFAALSLAIPPRARALGFSIGSLFVFPGLMIIPLVGMIADAWGMRWGMLMMTPVFVIGGLIISSGHKVIAEDIRNVWAATAARSEALYERRQGRAKLLLCRGLNVSYGDVQVLFDIDFDVDEGEIVALLGTNGAGKSTLLKAISGVVEADRGTVVFDGRDITHAPPNEIAPHGVVQVPGGRGVFPSLTVAENLRAASWMDRKDKALVASRIEEVLVTFPILEDRLGEPAANLSGGQQQMLALGMAFLSRPRLMMIDELSLGLAPVVVEQLVEIVRAMQRQGTTIIIVEQSVNVALTLAEQAYFMEKGEIRFHGPTAELLERPDVLRSVFLKGAAAGMEVRDSAGVAVTASSATAATAPSSAAATPGASTAATSRADDAPPGTGSSATASVQVRHERADEEGSGRPVLELSGVRCSFGGILAVRDVALEVAPGEIVGLIGPNGAGKTTLFDLISGFTAADGGRIIFEGTDITSMAPDRRARLGLGRSFQDAALFPALTVEQSLAVAHERWIAVRDPIQAALHLPSVFDAERAVARRVDELIGILGLEAFRSKFVSELSTGSRRIVDLACLVAHRPSLVLLDEPSSGIAQRETEALGPVIRRIRDELGASVLVIEHDMPLITSVSDRLVALDLGAVVTVGTPTQVLEHPQVVASYLGTTEAVIARSGAAT